VGLAGYMYFCVQDTSESDAYAWHPTEHCVQNMSFTSVSGGSVSDRVNWGEMDPRYGVSTTDDNRFYTTTGAPGPLGGANGTQRTSESLAYDAGTFAHTAGVTSGELVTFNWARTCRVAQSVYDCALYQPHVRCSQNTAVCSLLGTVTNFTAGGAASSALGEDVGVTGYANSFKVRADQLQTGHRFFCVEDSEASFAYDYFEPWYCVMAMALGTPYGTYYGENSYGYQHQAVSFPMAASPCGHKMTIYACQAASADLLSTCVQAACVYSMGDTYKANDTVSAYWTGDAGTYYPCMVDETDETKFTWGTLFTIYSPIDLIYCGSYTDVTQIPAATVTSADNKVF
jgi:hypothetical protein